MELLAKDKGAIAMGWRRFWSFLALIVGILLGLLALLADKLGVGRSPGFGRVQTAGLIIGVVLIVLGFLLRRSREP
jgi:Na+-driven multidrug efflux pump